MTIHIWYYTNCYRKIINCSIFTQSPNHCNDDINSILRQNTFIMTQPRISKLCVYLPTFEVIMISISSGSQLGSLGFVFSAGVCSISRELPSSERKHVIALTYKCSSKGVAFIELQVKDCESLKLINRNGICEHLSYFGSSGEIYCLNKRCQKCPLYAQESEQ